MERQSSPRGSLTIFRAAPVMLDHVFGIKDDKIASLEIP
jgi:hypothetical protein